MSGGNNVIAVTSQTRDDVIVISVKGNINLDNMKIVDKEFHDQLEKKPRAIGLDCRDITGIDSSGLGLLIRIKKESARENVETALFNITESIVALFDISKMSTYFNVMTNEEFNDNYLSSRP